MSTKTQAPSTWWGEFSLKTGHSKQWQVGPLSLTLRCLSNEWQLAYERQDDFDDESGTWRIADSDQPPQALDNHSRYIFRETTGQLTITPLLADRPVISRPNTPFNLTAGEEITLYISSPLWLELAVGNAKKKLQEIAIQRPSDTWFGVSTCEGELCYASTTHGRLHLEELPHRPHRAITPVTIRNQADSTLAIERLNIPAPMLTLYACANDQLWTSAITLTREKDGDMAALKIDHKLPRDAEQPVQLGKPRKTTNSGALIRAFSAVFS